MPESNFVNEEGAAVRVGSDGEHAFEKVEGQGLNDFGESTLVFAEGTGIGGGQIIDDFNDRDLAEYLDTGYVTLSTGTVYEGTHALGFTGYSQNNDDTSRKPTSFEGDGLDYYPDRGDAPFRIYLYLPSGVGPTSSTDDNAALKFGPIWGAQKRSGATDDASTGGYELECRYHKKNNEVKYDIYLTRDTVDGDIDIMTDPVDWPQYEDEWLYLEIDWHDSGNTVTLHRDADDSQIASVSHGNTDVDSGGVGYFPSGVSGPVLDFYKSS